MYKMLVLLPTLRFESCRKGTVVACTQSKASTAACTGYLYLYLGIPGTSFPAHPVTKKIPRIRKGPAHGPKSKKYTTVKDQKQKCGKM